VIIKYVVQSCMYVINYNYSHIGNVIVLQLLFYSSSSNERRRKCKGETYFINSNLSMESIGESFVLPVFLLIFLLFTEITM
jgi:hypothetical protein